MIGLKKLLFSINSALAKLLSDSLLLDRLLLDSLLSESLSLESLLSDSFLIGQFVIGQFVIGQFKNPITFKIVVTCVRTRAFVFFSGIKLPVGGSVALECLRLLCNFYD